MLSGGRVPLAFPQISSTVSIQSTHGQLPAITELPAIAFESAHVVRMSTKYIDKFIDNWPDPCYHNACLLGVSKGFASRPPREIFIRPQTVPVFLSSTSCCSRTLSRRSLQEEAKHKLTPLESALPRNTPVTRLESALPKRGTLSPLESALTKKEGGGPSASLRVSVRRVTDQGTRITVTPYTACANPAIPCTIRVLNPISKEGTRCVEL